jgi:hypothetical protein
VLKYKTGTKSIDEYLIIYLSRSRSNLLIKIFNNIEFKPTNRTEENQNFDDIDNKGELDPLAIWLRCILCPIAIPILFIYAYCCNKDSKIKQSEGHDEDDDDDDDDEEEEEEEAEHDSNILICLLNLVIKFLTYCGYKFESVDEINLTKLKENNLVELSNSKVILQRKLNGASLSKVQLKQKNELALHIGRTDRMIIEYEGDWIANLFTPKLDSNGNYIPRNVSEIEEKYCEVDELVSVEEPSPIKTTKHVSLSDEPLIIETKNEKLVDEHVHIPDVMKVRQVNIGKLKESLVNERIGGPTLSALANQSSPSLKSANNTFDQTTLKEKIRSKRRPWEPGSPMDDLINYKLNEYTSYINDDSSVGSMSVVDRLIIEYNHPQYLSSNKSISPNSSFSETKYLRKSSIDSTTSDITAQTFEN